MKTNSFEISAKSCRKRGETTNVLLVVGRKSGFFFVEAGLINSAGVAKKVRSQRMDPFAAMDVKMAQMDKMMDEIFRRDWETLDEFFFLSKLRAFPGGAGAGRGRTPRVSFLTSHTTTAAAAAANQKEEREEEEERKRRVQTAFAEAVRKGQTKRVASLLSHQLVDQIDSPNVCGGHKTTPLIDACAGGHIEIVRLLLEHGAQVNKKVGSQTPLFVAAKNGHTKAVELLLDHGAEMEPRVKLRRNSAAVVDQPGLFWDTPLHAAIRSGRTLERC